MDDDKKDPLDIDIDEPVTSLDEALDEELGVVSKKLILDEEDDSDVKDVEDEDEEIPDLDTDESDAM
jgi:hypothetical protein